MLEEASQRPSSHSGSNGTNSVEDGPIFKTQKLMILTYQLQEFLRDRHVGHSGEKKTLLQAHEYVYWPGITEDEIVGISLFGMSHDSLVMRSCLGMMIMPDVDLILLYSRVP